MTSERDSRKEEANGMSANPGVSVGVGVSSAVAAASPVDQCPCSPSMNNKSYRAKLNRDKCTQEDMCQRMAALEKLLYDLIVTQSQRERVLISHIAKLQVELERSRAINLNMAKCGNCCKQQQQQNVNSASSVDAVIPEKPECPGSTANPADVGSSARSSSTEPDVLDDFHKYDIEYEEVTLDKVHSNGDLGLALCCGDDNETDVFVEEVNPKSIAGCDGRIKQGDEIVEIDGVDVQNRQQALQLLSTDKSSITLVVARPHLKSDEDLNSVDSSIDGKKSICSTDSSSGERTLLNRLQVQSILEEDEDEYDEEDNLGTELINKLDLKQDTIEPKHVEDENSCVEKDSGVEKTDESTKNEESSEQESFKETNLNETGTNRKTLKLTKEPKRTDDPVNKSEAIEMWLELATSPKHTPGEDLCFDMFVPPPPMTDAESDLLSVVSCSSCRHCSNSFYPSQLKEYDQREKLARAIKLQQQLSKSFRNASSSLSKQPSVTSSTPRSLKSQSTLEWRVKQKPDGTRCIVRRPAKVKLLKERATQLAEERNGLTTDDDTMSEFKAGRYWSKEERRRHHERAKLRQKHKEELVQARNYNTIENAKQKSIIEMSRRKMMRVKCHGVLDDFTTVQELMAHGSHGKSDSKIPHRLLTVTTV
ncbi:E3 ubiquitin-protein ligase pdzrn3 [Chamberlinius hualienensis]